MYWIIHSTIHSSLSEKPSEISESNLTPISSRLDYLSFSRFDNPIEQGIPPSCILSSGWSREAHIFGKIRTSLLRRNERGTKKQKIGRLNKLDATLGKGWEISLEGGGSSSGANRRGGRDRLLSHSNYVDSFLEEEE